VNKYLLLFGFVLTCSCSSNRKYDIEKVNSNKTNSETTTTASFIPKIQIDSISDYNNFYINENYYAFTEISNIFIHDPKTQIFISPVFSWGDCSARYKKLFYLNSKPELYIFKADCGEYGFGNDQFYFDDDEISMARNFNAHIAEWDTDSTEIQWRINEIIYLFNEQDVLILTRERITENSNDNTLEKMEFTQSRGDRNTLLLEKRKEFNELMDFVVFSED
jgi:hypothetical protein